ncbi:MAG: hypothetical protein ACLR23_04060 [Clostridia bacterium]
MHAGEARNSRGQRAHGRKLPAGIVETAKAAENGIKMHAGEARKQQGPACTRRKLPAGIVETAKAAEKQDKNARR